MASRQLSRRDQDSRQSQAKAANTDRRAQRQQEATLRSEFPRQAKFRARIPRALGVTGSPSPYSQPRPPAMTRSAHPPRQKAAATPASHPPAAPHQILRAARPRSEKAKLAQLGFDKGTIGLTGVPCTGRLGHSPACRAPRLQPWQSPRIMRRCAAANSPAYPPMSKDFSPIRHALLRRPCPDRAPVPASRTYPE